MAGVLNDFFNGYLFDFGSLLGEGPLDTRNRAGLIIKTPYGIIMGHTPNEPRNINGWDLIKGHIETGENVKEAVAREAKEECGLDIDKSRLIELGKNKYREGDITFFGYELPDFTYSDLSSLDCTSMFEWYTDKQGKILPKGRFSKHMAEFKELDTFDIIPPNEVKNYMYYGLYKALTPEALEFIKEPLETKSLFESIYNRYN